LLGVALCVAAVWAQAPARRAAVDARQDRQIETAIRAKLAASKKLAAEGFTVRVQGGVATIEGKTDVVQRKGAATRLAKAGGAREVVNRIVVSAVGRAKASESLAAARRVQVKRGEPRSEPR
jgi:hypothetical protein